MRVHDTYTGSLVELVPPPGPIGIYWCGPTVYRRIHVGNGYAVNVLPLWLKRWLDQRGYETKVVVNITDINDKIYDAAPGASAGTTRRSSTTSRTSTTRSTTPRRARAQSSRPARPSGTSRTPPTSRAAGSAYSAATFVSRGRWTPRWTASAPWFISRR